LGETGWIAVRAPFWLAIWTIPAMISGVVTAAREAVIPVTVQNATGGRHPLQAVIDTGFNAELALPTAVVAALGLEMVGREDALLADGSVRLFDYFAAVIDWDGKPRRVVVLAADSGPLIGMAMLDGCELTIQAVPGGKVSITALG
jgi:clan AA aspartic protease